MEFKFLNMGKLAEESELALQDHKQQIEGILEHLNQLPPAFDDSELKKLIANLQSQISSYDDKLAGM